jgi:hypothetical protein
MAQQGMNGDIQSHSAKGLRGHNSPQLKHMQHSVVTGANLGFNATIAHQQNPNYQPFRKYL